MVDIIPSVVEKVWNKWNVQGVILFSLCLQIFLIASASLRKRTKSLSLCLVWFAYLLADWAASFCVGLISNEQDKKNSNITGNDFLMAFWAPFLLLHLGGPDTITAFALEDNELWLRHLLGLIFQVITTIYVFLLRTSHNLFWLPTVLMFVAGLTKYAERTRALYKASINNFRQSLLPKAEAGPNYAKLMEEYTSRKEAGLPTQIIIMPEPEAGYDNIVGDENQQVRDDGDISDLEAAQKAYYFFKKFKGLIVDMIYSFGDRHEIRQYFKNKNPNIALHIIAIELNFMYEAFYTKAFIIRHWLGYLCKFVSLISIVVALALFISTEKKLCDKFNVRVTYALLFGALVLDTIGFFMFIFTDYTATFSDQSRHDSYKASWLQRFKVSFFRHFNGNILVHFLKRRNPETNWKKIKNNPTYNDYHALSTPFPFRRWSESISKYNLVKYCLDELSVLSDHNRSFGQVTIFKMVSLVRSAFCKVIENFGGGDLLLRWKHEEKGPFLEELWKYIFQELKKKSEDVQDLDTLKSICSARGELALYKMDLDPERRQNLKYFLDPSEVAFDESLLLWHIATTICFFGDGDKCKGDKKETKTRDKEIISKLLSDYMLYLLIIQPAMMSAVAGIGQIRFRDTCEEAKKFLSKRMMREQEMPEQEINGEEKACRCLRKVQTEYKPIDVKGDRSKSVLFEACRLAKELDKLEDKKWEIICPVWVELLSFAASHCRPTGHLQLLSKGGELVSFVWILMVHLGLGTQFQIKEGHARAKLLVGGGS
ncbi:uncharacterized protein LOC129313948 [Prosopis cineraria]|uniref:uncharacterized protein LOC129313948 n=1 Tax=Prosopis cineraria TaxID=364024 RepID=UPI002410938F|nr:uncharacterized protein LOC129313948 [Prosopis cineraria]